MDETTPLSPRLTTILDYAHRYLPLPVLVDSKDAHVLYGEAAALLKASTHQHTDELMRVAPAAHGGPTLMYMTQLLEAIDEFLPQES